MNPRFRVDLFPRKSAIKCELHPANHGQATLSVTIPHPGRSGAFREYAHVRTSNRDQRVMTIELKGNYSQAIQVSPQALLIRNTGDTPFVEKILAVRLSQAGKISLELDPFAKGLVSANIASATGEKAFELRIGVRAASLREGFRSFIKLSCHCTNDTDSVTIPIVVSKPPR